MPASSPPTGDEAPGPDEAPPADATRDFQRLRRLLIGQEQARLRVLEDRGLDPKEVEAALHHSVRTNPGPLADAIHPVIGPAIRQSISSSLSQLVQRLNQALDHTFSWQGMQWRLEAYRTGVSFGEVVLRHSLAFRVEQVLLVHQETGLPLVTVVHPVVEAQDSGLLAGMLTAIQDFVRDSITGGEADGEIGTIELSGFQVLLARGPHAVLAAVVRGTPPRSLASRLHDLADQCHLLLPRELAEFDGDDAPFEVLRRDLEPLLEAEYVERSGGVSWFVIAFWLLVLVGAGWFVATTAYLRWRTSKLEATLTGHPGLVVTEVARDGERWVVRGLRDPLAPSLEGGLRSAGFEAGEVDLITTPFWSAEPSLRLPRARHVLVPPRGVALSVEGTRLVARGEAPPRWIERAQVLGRVIPGLTEVDLAGVEDLEARRRAALEEAERRALEARVEDLRAALAATPGIEPGAVEVRGDGFLVRGRRDPQAPAPEDLRAARGLSPEVVALAFDEFFSPDPKFLEPRARAELAPPGGVRLSIQDGTIVLEGQAPTSWIEAARARSVPGAAGVDVSALAPDPVEALTAQARALEREVTFFEPGAVETTEQEAARVTSLGQRLLELATQASRAGYVLQVEVRGHTDSQGAPAFNRYVSERRAAHVAQLVASQLGQATEAGSSTLTHRGVASTMPVRPEGSADADRWNRSATLALSLEEERK